MEYWIQHISDCRTQGFLIEEMTHTSVAYKNG